MLATLSPFPRAPRVHLSRRPNLGKLATGNGDTHEYSWEKTLKTLNEAEEDGGRDGLRLQNGRDSQGRDLHGQRYH
jgi:hypothetical protein